MVGLRQMIGAHATAWASRAVAGGGQPLDCVAPVKAGGSVAPQTRRASFAAPLPLEGAVGRLSVLARFRSCASFNRPPASRRPRKRGRRDAGGRSRLAKMFYLDFLMLLALPPSTSLKFLFLRDFLWKIDWFNASRTNWVDIDVETRQPTILRAKTSITKAT